MPDTFPGTNVPVSNTPTTPATPEKQTVQTIVLETGDGVEYCVGEFEDGDAKGLKYAYPRFLTVDAAISKFEADKVLEMLNQSAKAKIATKVKNSKVPKNVSASVTETQIAALKAGDPSGRGLIFTVEEAKAFKPGEREPGLKDMLNGMLDKAQNGQLSLEEMQAFAVKMAMKRRK